MKPTLKLAAVKTPDGGEMTLYEHDNDFSIRINGLDLMNSRQHESEQELARLGCAHLFDRSGACVLIGGLGMGYTLRQALDVLGPDANVVVSELIPEVVSWNREFLGVINANAVEDKRAELVVGDIFELLEQSTDRFDSILLDVDNGPTAMVDSANQRLYDPLGIQNCRQALRKGGVLAVWSTEPSKKFEKFLVKGGFKVKRYKVKNYQGSKTNPLFIWLAAEDQAILPPGGSDPTQTAAKEPLGNRKTSPEKVATKKPKIFKHVGLAPKAEPRQQTKKREPAKAKKEQA